MNSVYTPAEQRADAIVHIVGVGLAMAGAAWLLWRVGAHPLVEAMVLGVYGTTLVGTLATSAAYNLTVGTLKDRLRRLDHAMIFAMIAATYTPFVALRLPHDVAAPLAAVVGGGCALGALLKLAFPRRYDRTSIVLYLGMGWAIAWATGPLRASIGDLAFTLLIAGGCLYTLGVPFCLLERLRYHNALWHVCVLAGAMLHLASITAEFA